MAPTLPLSETLAAASPRLPPRPTSWISLVIQGGAMGLWAPLFLRGFVLHGAFAWAVGNRAYGMLGRWMLPVKSLDTVQPIYGLTAFGLLLFYVVTGRFGFVGLVAGVMGAKLAVDLAFHLWSIRLYRAWVGPAHPPGFLSGFAAALLEPFSFQLLRHLGAALGWVTFLTGRRDWGVQHRAGLAKPAAAVPAASGLGVTETIAATRSRP